MKDDDTTTHQPQEIILRTEPEDVTGLPASRPALTLIQGGAKTAPKTAATAKTRKGATREQIPVTVKAAPKDAKDLVGVTGVLTLSYRKGKPWTAQLDPHDENHENAEIPVLGFEVNDDGETYRVVSDTGRWTFARL